MVENRAANQFITRADELAGFIKALGQPAWIAVDTEFLREDTYWPKLCLIQVGTDEHIACIDPIALDAEAMAPLRELLMDPAVTKVFHAARQDMEVFHHAWGELPSPVFDTQVAASMLGYGDQVGYANLVQQVCGVELAKGHTRTDWQARPLPAAAVDYAADDVRYLGQVYETLLGELEKTGRREWLNEELDSLSDVSLYEPAPEMAWKRVKGLRKLRPRQLAVLSALADWREREALARNRPRRWILKDQALIDLARRRPESVADLSDMRDIPAAVLEKHGKTLVECIRAGADQPPPPVSSTPERLTPAQEAQVDALMALLRARCAEHQMSPAQVATRKHLEALVRGDEDLALLKGWRAAMAGRDLQALLAGDLQLRLEGGQLITVGNG